MHVRDATVDDLDTLIALGIEMRAESIVPYPPVDRDHVRKYLDIAVSMPDVFLTAIAEDDAPVGMMTAVAGPYCFSPVVRTTSDLLFVMPEYRGGTAAMRLVRKYKQWSDGLGADNDTLSIATGVSPERTGRFFEAMGFRPMQMIYRRDNVHGG